MNTKQKRWTSEQQILDAIDAERHRADALTKEAQAMDAQANDCVAKAKQLDLEIAQLPYNDRRRGRMELEFNKLSQITKASRKEAKRKMKTATRILDVKLKKLGAVLAAFRTDTMPFLGNDVAVVG